MFDQTASAMKMAPVCVLLALTLVAESVATATKDERIFPSASLQNLEPGLAPSGEGRSDPEPPDAPAMSQHTPAIPEPVNLGPDGFPKLPEVAVILGIASRTMQTVTEQASTLEKRVMKAQTEKAAKMAKQKAAYEEKLKSQETVNRGLVAQNVQVAQEITRLKEGNTGIKEHAHELQEANGLMRSELAALEARLSSAKEFVSMALKSSEDKNVKELLVLEPLNHLHHTKHDLGSLISQVRSDDAAPQEVEGKKDVEVAAMNLVPSQPKASHADDGADDEDEEEDDDDRSATSLLALKTRRAYEPAPRVRDPDATASMSGSLDDNPAMLVHALQLQVDDLAKEERASESQLKKLFLSEFAVGARRYTALLAQQQALNSTRAGLTELQARFQAAEAHLQGRKEQLTARLHAVGLYLQKLAHLALAPAAEVPHLMPALPGSVVLPAAPLATATTANEEQIA